jgi:dihydrodipicolinate synthase/N-acetylneuraminate lyase
MSESTSDVFSAERPFDPVKMVRPERKITGMSAMLLPFHPDGSVDWDSYRSHLSRTVEAGLVPAVNMDTGYANLIDDDTREQVLATTQDVLGPEGSFVGGAFVSDEPGADFDADAYRREIERIQEYGGTPIIFQSYGLTGLEGERVVEGYATMAEHCSSFIAFELGKMFAPFGRIYDLDTYGQLMALPECIGAKHSSLDRQLEWQRLRLRDEERPDFLVLTGNDLAIDMVKYGSDYLLGVSTFAPDLFAHRDQLWEEGDNAFYEVNDLLQYLGFFAFRDPVPAYKHSAAQFLEIRDWIESDTPHPDGQQRPESDRAILQDIADRVDALMS